MVITYRNNLVGIVIEEIDEYGISFCDGKVYFNDKVIDISAIIEIQKNINKIRKARKGRYLL